ncbi:NACHT domain-containing protein [Spirosoma endbachense]|uniref:NACHT domain-containing protein n=1 Tax=Spirosoma endbachense TaxID=2666025 RepID=A0A6P1VV16_9BACT|nr:NACHT domain-containing protein [Spirosoma endbachense]QHV96565.1 NACHT domain-containing protein [Spirosoma endbachense]
MNSTLASAQGDRIDFAGKYPQFRLFAAKVYDELVDNTLAWIKIGDPEAGKLDDIQFATRTEIHAFQVKWSAANKTPAFRYKELVQLLPDLLTSWQQLVFANQSEGKRLRIYLLSNRLPSENDQIKLNGVNIGSFRHFIMNVWNPLRVGGKLSTLAPSWRSFVKKELANYKIDQNKFVHFVQSSTLIFGDTLPDRSSHRHYHTYKKDTDALFDFILSELHDPAHRVLFTASELKKALGWEERTQEIFSHDFFVDPTQYEPNTLTLRAISSAVDKLSGGYIFVQGGPGTGKSTLLTEWAKSRRERVIRYFIYLNQGAANGRTSTRGDALHLYHDLSVQLANQGVFKEGVLHTAWDLGQIQSIFTRQLVELKQEYQNTGQKAIIIIDGLDHIPREYHPNQNLLHFLPAPNDIPEGVYFVLGSQTYELNDLFPPVRQAFDQVERWVEMEALSKATVGTIAERKLGRSLSDTIQDQIFQRSAGHPLYLSYIMRSLSSIDVIEIEDRLKLFPLIDGDIVLYYDSIWQEFADNEVFIELMGLIARLRYGVHNRMLLEWQLSHPQKLLLKRLLDQFFDQFFGYRNFFHNSFRQYVIKKSAIDILTDTFDEQNDKLLYGKLAERSQHSGDRLFQHDYLYYLYQAGRYETFMEIASASYFDQQRHRFRPLKQIIEDLRLGLTIAAQHHSLNKLLEYGFLTAEIQNRSYHQDQSQFFTLFPQLLSLDSLAEYALTLSSDQVKPTFQLVRLLYGNGHRSEARRLFALKEPVELSRKELVLTQQLTINYHFHNVDELLTEWIRTVALWADPAVLVPKILSLTYQESPWVTEYEHIAEEERKKLAQIKSVMLETLVDSLSVKKETRSLAKTVLQHLSELHSVNLPFLIRQHRLIIEDCLADKDGASANEVLTQLLNQVSPNQVTKNILRVSVAELIYQVRRDSILIQEWLNNISTVDELEELNSFSFDKNTFEQYRPDLWFITLKAYVGDPVRLHEYFREKEGDDTEGYNVLVNWMRSAGEIAQLGGESNHELHLSNRILLPLARFYYAMPERLFHHRYWYFAERGREGYFQELVHTIGLYGHHAIQQAGKLFKQEFIQQSTFWPAKLRRQIWLDLGQYGFPSEYVKAEIELLESELLNEESDVMSRQKEALKQANVWLILNEPEHAKRWVTRSLDEAFGIKNEKDYQLSDWAGWLKRVNDFEPTKAAERIRWLAGYIKYVRQVTQSAAAEGLSDELLDATWQWNTQAGILLFNWSLSHGYSKLQDGLASLLGTLLTEADESVIPSVASFYGSVFLYNSSKVDRSLLKQLVNRIKLHTNCSQLIRQLLLDIDRYALPESRPTYQEVLEEVNVVYQSPRYIPEERSHWRTATKIHVGGHTPMTNREIAALVNNLDELKSITPQAKLTDNGGVFDWMPVLQKVKQELIEAGIATMLDTLPGDKHVAFNLLTALAELAVEAGQSNTARSIGRRLLADERGGWLTNYDEGKRLAAYRILTKLDGDSAHKEAWADFARSFIESGNISYLRDLATILPVVSPGYDVLEVWLQIEHYITRLMGEGEWDSHVPILEDQKTISPETCLATITLRLATSYEKGVSESAQVFFAHQLVVERQVFLDVLNDYFVNADDFGRLMFTRMMLYLANYHPALLIQFRQHVQQLLKDRLFNVRVSAYQLWRQMGEFPSTTSTVISPLPWGDYWRLFEVGVLYVNFDEDQHWVDNKINADDVLHILDTELQLLTQLVGIPELILGQRIVEILNTELSDKKSALSLRAQAVEFGIEAISYPYNLVADYVLNVILGELVEHGYFQKWLDWSGIVPFFDPNLWYIEHQRWPSFIEGIFSPENVQYGSYQLDEKWPSKADQSLIRLTLVQGEQIILAERSFFRGLGWEYDSELRESCVDFSGRENLFSFDYGAFKNYNRLMMAEVITLDNSPSLIIANHGMNLFDTPQNIVTWLAFNPRIAKEMGWHLSDQGVFRWLDIDNTIMVESIFWTDGNTRMNPPHLGSETGSGWLTLSSEKAFAQLSSKYKFVQRQHVHRWSRVKSTQKTLNGEASRIVLL